MSNWNHRFSAAGRGLTRALVAGALGLLAFSAFADDDPPGRVGRLAETRGQVWLLEAGQGEWQTAERNRPVTTADRIATDNGSRAELQIGSTTIRLDQASDLEVNRLDDDRVELTLHGGAAAVRVREPEVAREVQISTAEGRFQPRGPGLFRFDHGERGSMASAAQGEIDFESSDSQLTLRPGQRAELWLDANDHRTHYNWAGMPNDEFEQWVRTDEVQDQRVAARRPISPEMTGAEDLEANGQWDTHPEYGAVWYPTTVVAAGRLTAMATGPGSAPGAGPGSTMRRGALRHSTTVAGSASAAAGAGRRAPMCAARSMRRRWWPGSAALT
jgi:hypothetical protein